MEGEEDHPLDKKKGKEIHQETQLPNRDSIQSEVSNVGSPMTNVDYQFNESMFLQVKTIFDAQGQSGSSSYPQMQNTAHDDENVDNPWNSSLFDGMQLDKVVDEDEQQEGESDQNFDHTWNLDGKNSNR
nr:uncharacterized protein LOC127315857 [Lolium perenne]